jgi:hypothetical protein
MSSDAAFLLACNGLHEGKIQEALPQLVGRLADLPESIVQNQILPSLQRMSLQNNLSNQVHFYNLSNPPQLLELIETPKTSIYGRRITYWTFYEKDPQGKDKQSYLIVTGHGPGPVCTRISAILNNLANERNCSSDLILAGLAIFDLRKDQSIELYKNDWNEEELNKRVSKLAEKLSKRSREKTKDLVEREKGYLFYKLEELHKTPFTVVRESLDIVEKDIGFLYSRRLDLSYLTKTAEEVSHGTSPSVEVAEPFPVVLSYGLNGQPLQIKLPQLCLGLPQYQRVVSQYRRSVIREIEEEWERRCLRYEEWAKSFDYNFARLSEEREQNPAAFAERIIYITSHIDFETAIETKLDTPEQIKAEKYLDELLPPLILNQLLYWAWALDRKARLPREADFRPHWEQTCLIDAFLRDWSLPLEDKRLTEVYQTWKKQWRSLAFCYRTVLRKR